MIMFAQGVDFQNITFREAFGKAKKENKLVFMDCYTNGCSYCVKMDKEIFSLKSVGNYMNKNFVCVKYNVREGDGPKLKEKYKIGGFPHFVILTPEGDVVHKFMGYRQEKAFFEELELRFDNKCSFGAYQKRYVEGERSVEFLNEYIQVLQRNRDRGVAEVFVELAALLSDEEKVSAKYWFLFSGLPTVPWGTPNCEYLVRNYASFASVLGEEKVEDAVFQKFDGAMAAIVYLFEEKDITMNDAFERLEKVNQEITCLPEGLQAYARLQIELIQQRLQQDYSGVIATCKEKLDELPSEKYIERVYSILYGKIISRISPEQKNEWEKLGEKLLSKMENKDLQKRLEQLINRNR